MRLRLLSKSEAAFTDIRHLWYPKGKLCQIREADPLSDDVTDFQRHTKYLFEQAQETLLYQRICVKCFADIIRIHGLHTRDYQSRSNDRKLMREKPRTSS